VVALADRQGDPVGRCVGRTAGLVAVAADGGGQRDRGDDGEVMPALSRPAVR